MVCGVESQCQFNDMIKQTNDILNIWKKTEKKNDIAYYSYS